MTRSEQMQAAARGEVERQAERIRELEAEVERLRDALIWINNQLPINSALKPHIAAALLQTEGE